MQTPAAFRGRKTSLLSGFFAGVFEQKIQDFFGPDMIGDTAERSVLFEGDADGGHRLTALLRNPLDLVIHLFLGGVDGLALGNAVQQKTSLDFANRTLALALANLLPIELDVA